MTTSASDNGRQAPDYLCEYSHHPFAECYCRNVTGRTVPSVVQYCMDRFRECPVYRQHAVQQTQYRDEAPE